MILLKKTLDYMERRNNIMATKTTKKTTAKATTKTASTKATAKAAAKAPAKKKYRFPELSFTFY